MTIELESSAKPSRYVTPRSGSNVKNGFAFDLFMKYAIIELRQLIFLDIHSFTIALINVI